MVVLSSAGRLDVAHPGLPDLDDLHLPPQRAESRRHAVHRDALLHHLPVFAGPHAGNVLHQQRHLHGRARWHCRRSDLPRPAQGQPRGLRRGAHPGHGLPAGHAVHLHARHRRRVWPPDAQPRRVVGQARRPQGRPRRGTAQAARGNGQAEGPRHRGRQDGFTRRPHPCPRYVQEARRAESQRPVRRATQVRHRPAHYQAGAPSRQARRARH